MVIWHSYRQQSAETIRLALTCMHEYVWTYDEQFKKKFMDPEIT